MRTMTATHSDTAVLEAAGALAQAIQASAEWRELFSAQQAAETDSGFARMVARQDESVGLQN